MPDVHAGHGATVGSVVATRGAIVPACVGVDIGCGMMAVKTPFMASQLPDSLKTLRDEIQWNVPVGFMAHASPRKEAEEWTGFAGFKDIPSELHDKGGKALKQLGTLGGGNHFIELCLDTEQCVWVMLHSGSRNIGKEIAEVYINKAKDLMKWYMIDLADPDLAYLIEESQEFRDYWRDLQWAQSYAMKNREIMMHGVMKAIAKVLLGDWKEPITRLQEVNCHHNYAEREHHFGSNVIVTRKGAVRARHGDMGTWGSFLAPWGLDRTSSADWGMTTHSIRALMAPVDECRAAKRKEPLRLRISQNKPLVWNAGRIAVCSTKSPEPIKISIR